MNKDKLLKNQNLLLIFEFLIIFGIHLLLKTDFGDDLYFSNISLSNILEWLVTRYKTWSSRLIIEACLVFVLKFGKIFWCVIDSIIILWISRSISEIFTKNTNQNKIYSFIAVCTYPLIEMSGAGWISTTINYLWPLGFGLYYFSILKKIIYNYKVKKYEYILLTFSLICACNQEQLCCIILAFNIIFFIYTYCKEKQLNKVLLFELLISILNIILILTCPGNIARKYANTGYWYPEFENFNFLQKFLLGFVSTLNTQLVGYNIPIIILSILIPYNLRNCKSNLIRINSLIPLAIIMSLNIFAKNIFPSFSLILNQLSIYITKVENLRIISGSFIISLIIDLIFVVSLIVSVKFIFEKISQKNIVYLYILIFLSGIFSRIIMGFSPTIYASGLRTFIFYDFSVIILSLKIAISELNNKKPYNIEIIYVFASIMQIINTVILGR